MTEKPTTVYLACPHTKSMAQKNLVFCLTQCEDRCEEFFNLPEEKILAVIRTYDGKHEIKYDQLKLFPMKPSRQRR